MCTTDYKLYRTIRCGNLQIFGVRNANWVNVSVEDEYLLCKSQITQKRRLITNPPPGQLMEPQRAKFANPSFLANARSKDSCTEVSRKLEKISPPPGGQID